MNFSSIKEYFYKLYNVCYLLLLLPLVIFIFLYYQLEQKKIDPLFQDESMIIMLLSAGVGLSVINLTTVQLVTKRRLKSYAAIQGLGAKLDKYHEIIFLRFAAGAVCCLLMAVGLVLTASEYFALVFILLLSIMAIQWPTSRKACDALRLKGDEYKMVFFKTEQL